MKPAIILSGQIPALGVARSLGKMGVLVVMAYYNEQDFAHHSRFVKYSFQTPHPEKQEKGFVDSLLARTEKYKGAVLIPASDESLVAVSRHKEELSMHYQVACTEWEVTRSFIDKQFTYSLAERCGVPAPRTLVLQNISDARSAARELGFPCLVKPCQGHLFTDRFGCKMVQVDSLGQLEKTYSEAADAGLEVMLQEIIPGDDCEVVNYNAYVWDKKFLTEFTAIHLRNAPPWFGSTRIGVSQEIPEVIEPGRRILLELGFSGYACTEFKRDPRDGVYKLMEVNGRHNLSTLLAVKCGINFPWLHYRHLSEGVVPAPAKFREGVYWIDMLRDLGATLAYLTRERHSPFDYLRPYMRTNIFATLDRTDFRPFLMRLVCYARQGKKA